jgi:hypothetical protein
MSLSYPGGLEQALAHFHLRFMPKHYARCRKPVPGQSAPGAGRRREVGRQVQLSADFHV